jgi:hypothetical protein
MAVEDDWKEMPRKAVQRRLHMCCSYRDIGVINVWKSVIRI